MFGKILEIIIKIFFTFTYALCVILIIKGFVEKRFDYLAYGTGIAILSNIQIILGNCLSLKDDHYDEYRENNLENDEE